MATAKKIHEQEALRILDSADYTQRVYFNVLDICLKDEESIGDLLDSLSYDGIVWIRG